MRCVAAAGLALLCTVAGSLSAAGSAERATPPAVPVWGSPVQAGTIADGHTNHELVTADVNGDGLTDVVVGDLVYDRIQAVAPVFLLNRGGGRFVDATASLFDGSPPAVEWNRWMVVADFNGDRRPDFFIADDGSDNQSLNPGWPGQQNKLILSQPDGKYRDATANLPQRFTFSHEAAAADVNGDGAVDIYENNIGGLGRSHAQADILLNDGTGHFTVSTDRLPGIPHDAYGNSHSYACAFADVNGDGHPDLILGGNDAVERSSVLLNDGHGFFNFYEWLPPKLFAPNALVLSIVSTDVNGDGATDLLLAETQQDPNYYIGSKIQVLINDGHGGFTDETSTRLPDEPVVQSWPFRILLEDMNDDGRQDIALQYAPPGIVPAADPTSFWLNENGVFTRIRGAAQGSSPAHFGMVGFVNGDGPHAFFSIESTTSDGPVSYDVSPQIVIPSAVPASLRARPTAKGVRLSWQAVEGAAGYEIWQPHPPVELGSTTTRSWLDTRAGHVRRSYEVRARNAAGAGPFSPSVSGKRLDR